MATLALAGCDAAQTTDHVPQEIQAQLPLNTSFAAACPQFGNKGARETERARIKTQLPVLLRELRDHPEWQVEVTGRYSEGGTFQEHMTVREIAQEQVEQIGTEPGCLPGLRRQLERALAETD
jgi:hypothetical protein